MKRLILILIHCLYSISLSQSGGSELEKVLESIDPEARNSMQIDEIEELAANPVPLVKSSLPTIAALPGFNAFLAEKIISVATSANSIGDVCRALSLSEEQAYILKLCTKLEKRSAPALYAMQYRGRAAPELDKVRGLQNGAYRGNGWDISNRLRFSVGDFGASILTNKNMGEPRAVEQLSGNITYSGKNISVVAGDFVVQSGMGAVLSKPFGTNSGLDPVSNVIRYTSALRPYTGSYDLGFFRGVAAKSSIHLGKEMNLSLIGFASSKDLPGTLDSLSGDVTSVYSAAYYRTASEISKKKRFTERAAGGIAEISWKGLTFSSHVLHLDYSRVLRSESKSVFRGKCGTLSGISMYGTVANDFAINAESSVDADGHVSFSSGIEYFGQCIELGALARYFPNSFRSPYGSNFGSSETPANESGIFTAATWKPDTKNSLSLHIDLFRTPAAEYRNEFVSDGISAGLDYESKVSASSRLFLRFRLKDESGESGDSSNTIQYRERTLSLRGEYRKEVSSTLSAMIRADFSSANFGASNTAAEGSALTLGLQMKLLNCLSIASRGSVYSTDGYPTAIWIYDGSLPGMLRTVALYGSGFYWTLSAGCEFYRKCILSLKYFENIRFNTESVGSGNDEIDSGTGRGMFLQIDLGL